MGCKSTNTRQDVIKSVSFHISLPPQVENIGEFSENSIKECSFIPLITENPKLKGIDDPSIYKMIQDM
jgi:hypothetical protein